MARDDRPIAAATGAAAGQTSAPSGRSSGRTIALLAPVTGPNAERGDVLVKAAQLALSEPGSPTLDVRDTASTPAGAAAAAQAAIAAGAGIIIGPLSATETAAVAGPATAAGIAVLAFTNDASQGRAGVWPLGISPAQQVRRLVTTATGQSHTRFAAVLPQNDFGQAMGTALTQAAASAGLATPELHFHESGNAAIASAIRDVSGYASRRGPLDAQIKAARARHDAEGRRQAAELSRQGVAPPSFDALLLADTGDKLAWLSTFLAYYDIDPPRVQIMGPSLWAQPAARAGAALGEAWYAAPDPAARAGFEQAYQVAYGAPPPGLADLAYDAATIGRTVTQADGSAAAAALARPEGFAGVDGMVALQPNGVVRRALAVFQIQPGGATILEPPPSLAAPGS